MDKKNDSKIQKFNRKKVEAKMIVSIHQPNYIPWIGYFHKIAQSDVFVVFDDVQFPRGKNFVNRNQIKTSNGPKWITVPVNEKNTMQSINQIKLNNELDWRRKHLATINAAYAKSNHFIDYKDILERIYEKKHEKLVDLNVEFIKAIMSILNIKTVIKYSSEICKNGKGQERIINILKELGADTYLTGQGEGSKRYIEEKEFAKNNIKLIYHEFHHPVYNQQFGEFIENMSIIDLIFNEGKNARRFFEIK